MRNLPARLAAAWLASATAVVAMPPGFHVLESDPAHVVIRYEPGQFSQQAVSSNGHPFVKLQLPETSVSKVRGAPELPQLCRSVIIPAEAEMAVRVQAAEHYDLHEIEVAPSKGYLPRSVDPQTVAYEWGPEYELDAFYPRAVATLGRPYILRDQRAAVLELSPFQYNPVTHTLRVYTNLTVELTPVGPGKVNVPRPRLTPRACSRAFSEIYRTQFVNYALEERSEPVREEGDLLIITHDEWITNLQPLAAHKNARGIDTTIVGVSTIGNEAGLIKAHIQDVYDSSDLAFVLLVGDAAQVATPYAALGAADPFYSLLAGDDTYPEIIVGRFSAETAAQVDTQVQRTIEYEQANAPGQMWFKSALGIASNQGPGDDGELDWEHIDHIRTRLLAADYYHVDQVYAPTAEKEDVIAALQAGRGLVNYCGHGSWNGWNTTVFSSADVDALTNVGHLPLIVSCACNNGEFDNYTCFGEAWLRATHIGQPTGAVGVYAASSGQYWQPPMAAQDEIADLMLARVYGSFGALCYGGSCLMMDQYPAVYGEQFGGGADMFLIWILFGDPSLQVAQCSGLRVLPLGGMHATGPRGGPFSPNALTCTLRNRDPVPLEYEVSCLAAWMDVSNAEGVIQSGEDREVTISLNELAATLGRGIYETSVSFVNHTHHDGDSERLVTLEVGRPEPMHVFQLDTDPGWSRTGEWQFGVPAGGGGSSYGLPDPTAGATGTNVFGINLAGDYAPTVEGPQYLTTTALDCSHLTQLSLRFQRWLNTDYYPYVEAVVEASKDAEHWALLWRNPAYPNALTANQWSPQSYDLSFLAQDAETIYVRWGHQVRRPDAFPLSGWNLDDIEIWGLAHCLPGDLDCDDDVDLADLDALTVCLAGPDEQVPVTCVRADLDEDDDVDLCDVARFHAWFSP